MLITYPYRNNLSAYAPGFIGLEGRHTRPNHSGDGRPGCGTRGRRQALHPLRGDAPDQNGCNAYGSGAMPTDRVHRTTLEYPKEESAAPHASPVNRNTRSHKTPKHRRCGGRRRAWRARAAAPVGGGGAWPDKEPTHRIARQHTRPHRCEGRRRDRRARQRYPWAAAGPGRASRSAVLNHTPAHQAPLV